MADDLKQAEQRGYSRGYNAGRRRVAIEESREARERRRKREWNRLFAGLLPVAMTVGGWTIAGNPVTSTEQRVRLAECWADEAIKKVKLP